MAEDKASKIILWFEEIGKDDIPLAGGKGANLGEMVRAGIPVPPGFVVSSTAYRKFVTETGILDKINEMLKGIDVSNVDLLEKKAEEIKKLILETPMPEYIEKAIREAYRELAKRVGVEPDKLHVAVRSSATAEDLPDASFAGQQDTYLNVVGEDSVVEHVKKCWASLFNARAIAYRVSKGIPHENVAMATVVQKMVNADKAGVMFTLDVRNGDSDKITIEASWGLGEAVVGGKVTPDTYIVDKNVVKELMDKDPTEVSEEDLKRMILEKHIAEKKIAILYDPEKGGTVEVELPEEKAKAPALSDREVFAVAKMGVRVEDHYGRPMDIEWAIDKDIEFPKNVFMLQARPETVWSARKEVKVRPEEEEEVEHVEAEVLVRGLPASPGIGVGVAKVLFDPKKDADKFNEGDVLVTKMTDPDWVPLMRKASAIVTDEGGMTSHAAIVSRELGIPAVVGTKEATKKIQSGMVVTVDGYRGVVYKGKVRLGGEKEEKKEAAGGGIGLPAEELRFLFPATGTKIYMNLGEPNAIDRYKDLPFDGIGLMRIEFIITDWIGYHPLYLIKQGKETYFINKLADGIAKVASAIYPRPVVVRFSDFKSNEYRGLKGGEEFEPEERNPMLGWRGVSRYISPKYEPAFRLELRAIKKVREEFGLKNVWVMLPFVRTTWEVEKVLNIMKDEGLERNRDFKVWIMAEVPSVVLLADQFSQLVDGFSIGSNDLTQLVLGADRDSDLLARMGYFDERDPAVLKAIEMLIKTAHKYGRTVSICGQGPSVYPELVEFLVKAGIDSISVNPDAVIRTRYMVAGVERKVMLRRLAELEEKLGK
ncbi:phosphoenolpyruvate synthase [Ignicoccus pacificus DSM 13166]|uniref:Phosphoenolpyruvate synthase n=1 Tax=Ignicoccus pacificus DSM 13166 TaxID=940294 RepID=A0A977K9U8_9CREN|nr:phosphoenolpyruvate synthase [Ignicoccus pacificus DSM 13166]